MLYEPAQFEPLTDEPWDPARVEDAIAAIVADTDAAFGPETLWPAHGQVSLPAPGSISTRSCCLQAPELIWRAGAHGDEKGHGLCHGTSGNGFALLKAFVRTGDERWLEGARRFAVHALGQVARLRAANGRGRYSLWTGNVGTALFAAACLDVDMRYPILDFV